MEIYPTSFDRSTGRSGTALHIGPVVLALVVVLQTMLWIWSTWLPQPIGPTETRALTALGRAWYHPDHDLPVYAAGLLLCLLLATGLNWLWRRQHSIAPSDDETRRLTMISTLHLPMAFALAVLPAEGTHLIAAGVGSVFIVASLCGKWLPRRWVFPRMRLPTRYRPAAGQAVAVGLIALIVYVPDVAPLVAGAYTMDHFHHIDFYVMAPALAFRHDLALGTDFYTQYGVGWPVIFAALSTASRRLSYSFWMQLCIAWGCFYYFVLYAFLSAAWRSKAWAIAGLLVVLLLELLSGTGNQPKWLWPSSTVMRYSMDVFLFAACLSHARTGQAGWGVPVGVIAGLALLLSTDTGLYLLLCLGAYAVSAGRVKRSGFPRSRTGRFAALAALSLLATVVGGLAIASRGTLVRPEFWMGWSEALRIYNHGFSHLPIAEALQQNRIVGPLLVLMLTCYLYAVMRLLQGFRNGHLTPEHQIAGVIAIYGLATLLLFISRSHLYNLTHVSIPFCILLTGFAAEFTLASTREAAWLTETARGKLNSAWSALPYLCAIATLAVIWAHPASRIYPNLMMQAANRLKGRDTPPVQSRGADTGQFQAVTATMRELSEQGAKSVAMIDGADTAYLVEADLAPRLRYSPVIANLAYTSQLALVKRQLALDPRTYLLMPVAAPLTTAGVLSSDTFLGILDWVESRYVEERRVGAMVVYRLKTPRAGPPP